MTTLTRTPVALFVNRATKEWIVRDPDGNVWQVSTDDDGWDKRVAYEITEDMDLEPIPGHYKYMLRLPF